ncbi:hypothetical protein D3C87_1324540 [compost metagenome]
MQSSCVCIADTADRPDRNAFLLWPNLFSEQRERLADSELEPWRYCSRLFAHRVLASEFLRRARGPFAYKVWPARREEGFFVRLGHN